MIGFFPDAEKPVPVKDEQALRKAILGNRGVTADELAVYFPAFTVEEIHLLRMSIL